jgi:precorrin 3B synthase CobZ
LLVSIGFCSLSNHSKAAIMVSLTLPQSVDVLIIGGGNAGFTAAITAAQAGAGRVVLIEKAPQEWAGGNTYFTAGAFRTVHSGIQDLLPIVNNVDGDTAKLIDMEPYTAEDFRADFDRVCSGRSDPALSQLLISESNNTIKWLARNGIRFQLSFNRQAYEVEGRFEFWGGMSLKTEDGGKGLIADHQAAAQRNGVEVFYSTFAKSIVTSSSGDISAVIVEYKNTTTTIHTKAVILAAGGFEANPRMRSKYLGPNWDAAYVRGTPFNTWEALEFAVRDVNAKKAGDWSGCHSTCWDANAPASSGDRKISNEFAKSGYPLGLMLNNNGVRFVDEGIDMRNYTYAKLGRAVHEQPEGVAFQVWDQRMIPWLRNEEYRDERVIKIWGATIQELAHNLAQKSGLNAPQRFIETIKEYNEAAYAFQTENPNKKWDPAVKDGVSTQSSTKSLVLAKSNWALPLDQGPFMAVKVRCGVTFTFGGLAVNPETTAVISTADKEVTGLFCVGEMLGGIFYDNYPGGSGLTSGAVFGRRAGAAAAKVVGARAVTSLSEAPPVKLT